MIHLNGGAIQSNLTMRRAYLVHVVLNLPRFTVLNGALLQSLSSL